MATARAMGQGGGASAREAPDVSEVLAEPLRIALLVGSDYLREQADLAGLGDLLEHAFTDAAAS